MSDKDEMKELGLGIAKATIGAIPVAGGLLNELVFDIRGKTKQARYNRFVEALADYMNSHFHVTLTIEQIEQEQIGDFFESVVTRVVKIGAQKRIDALKRLLATKIIEPKEFDYAEVLADLLAGISDYELLIMQKIAEEGGGYADHYSDFSRFKRELDMLYSRRRERQGGMYGDEDWINSSADTQLQRLIEEEEEKVNQAKEQLQTLKTPYEAATYNLESWKFYFYLSQLIQKGILVDESGGLGVSALTVVAPNQVAFDMVNFLVD